MSNNPFDNNHDNQVSLICDAVGVKPRICQCIQVVNESTLIESCMLQIYDKVDRIIIIEGATQSKVVAGQATVDGHSTDDTVEIIKNVIATKDPDKKIIFVQIDRPWESLEEIKNTFFSYMTEGDWMLITDADEFIKPFVVDHLRKAVDIEPFATEFIPIFYHFWKDTTHIRNPNRLGFGIQHQRFIKYQTGLHYRTHPVATDAYGRCTYFDPAYLPRRFVLPSFEIYHYSYMNFKSADIEQKKTFYERELKDSAAHTERVEIDSQFFNDTEGEDDLLLFPHDDHPNIIKQMMWYNDTAVSLMQDNGDKKCWPDYKSVPPYGERLPLILAYANEGREPFTKLYNDIEECGVCTWTRLSKENTSM